MSAFVVGSALYVIGGSLGCAGAVAADGSRFARGLILAAIGAAVLAFWFAHAPQ